MKKLFVVLTILMVSLNAYASDLDYDSLYDAAFPFESKLFNDIDPFENEDSIKYAYSPYPLFRTSANLYFKDYTIEPGYYSLTPRVLKGKDYVFFKQNGKVQFIIPVAKKEATPINFYEANTPQMKKTVWQKFSSGVRDKFYSTAKNSMKAPPPKSHINIDADTKYIILTLFYGEDKYTLLFRRTPYWYLKKLWFFFNLSLVTTYPHLEQAKILPVESIGIKLCLQVTISSNSSPWIEE